MTTARRAPGTDNDNPQSIERFGSATRTAPVTGTVGSQEGMGRARPSRAQNLLSSVILPLLSVCLLPASLTAVAACIVLDRLRGWSRGTRDSRHVQQPKGGRGCMMISGGRMSKGLHLARAFKRAGWKVIGVEEKGWGDLCPMRFSSAVDEFYLLPPAAESYDAYSSALIDIAQSQRVTLFIPVSGAGSSVEDARAAEHMTKATEGRCRTFIQDAATMEDLHDKDRFMALVERLGFTIPAGQLVTSSKQAVDYLKTKGKEPRFILKCLGLDENRGDMTLFPLAGDDGKLSRTKKALDGLSLGISKDCPYVFQEFIPGPEWCTHASVVDGRLTSFVACPSNDMLMTYENGTEEDIGRRAEQWTRDFLDKLGSDGQQRRLTGHFSFDFIVSTRDGQLYPIECNARVHTAVIMLPLDRIAACYDDIKGAAGGTKQTTLRPVAGTLPRSWLYNDLFMRYLPRLLPSPNLLGVIHPSLPACIVSAHKRATIRPDEGLTQVRLDPSLVADDWAPFLVLWHVFWPSLLLIRWWQGKYWTRLNVSTGRIFEA